MDLEGKEELADSIREFAGGLILVSHDRDLIEASCNRFWLVKDGKLEEWHDIEKVYAELTEVSVRHPTTYEAPLSAEKKECPIADGHDDLLERLFELEALLEADTNRKQKHQKVQRQTLWKIEIDKIKTVLSL
ncbi:hypothetical protein [Veronia nyctiphanis]|uniref:hypothetical protein n=1 Tax=Veronia nyctiphanis TaxID=1278244 RepID=UPI002E2733B4